MKTFTVKRYQCDHCRKRTFQVPAMVRHEKSCVKNPQRECSTCRDYGLSETAPLSDLISAVPTGIERLRALTECPVCIVSALCQHRKANPSLYASDIDEVTFEDTTFSVPFDYKAEIFKFRQTHDRLDRCYIE